VRVLIDYRPALRQRTGVGEYAHGIAAALVSALPLDGAVLLFSSSWKDRLSPSTIPGAVVVDRRIPVRVLNAAWHRLEWPPAELIAGSIDVVHSMHPLLIPARNAAQVITIHDLYFLEHPEKTQREIRRDYPRLAQRHAQRADAVVVVSRYTAAQVTARLGVDPDRIVLCPPGAPPWRPRAAPPKNGPILFMGSLDPRKNVATLLTAFERLLARLPDAPNLLLAGGSGNGASSLLERLAQPPLAGHVRHLGYVGDQDRETLYREASMLVLPSFDEGFGMPVLEAMTVGTPVVVSSRGALPEVAGDAGLIVDPEDPGALAAAMERLLRDVAFARQCSERGTARAGGFSWEASARTLVDAYRAAVERRRSRKG
jgi:glycosyltransferase involved in cell wall biosynthesis